MPDTLSILSGTASPTLAVSSTSTAVPQPAAASAFSSGGPVSLGNLFFDSFDVPSQITYGGKQSLKIHKMIGGARQIDAMGDDPNAVSWTGLFLSSDATARAQTLEQMRVSGDVQALLWGAFNINVVIDEATFVYKNASEIEYTVSCEILDVATAITPKPTLLQSVSVDAISAATVVLPPALASTQSALAQLGLILRQLSSMAGPQGQVVLNRLISAQSQLEFATTQGNDALSSLGDIGAPGQTTTQLLATLNNANDQLGNLTQIGPAAALVGRAINNIQTGGLF
jgi:hypothetical protein